MKDKYSAVVLLGAPGSGKGTQGKALGQMPDFFHCACGDIFRALCPTSPLGKQTAEYTKKGRLVPDELTVELWKNQIDSWVENNHFNALKQVLILDGIPRNVEQAKLIASMISLKQVVHFSCSDHKQLVERIIGRGVKEQRSDDISVFVIENRISTYSEETKPILDFYPKSLQVKIDAMQPPLKVLADLISHLILLDDK